MAITLDDITDDLLENASFEEDASVTKAKAFVTAAKRFLLLSPQSQSDQGSSLTMGLEQVEGLLKRAQQYVKEQQSANASNSRVRFLSAREGFYR